MIKFHAKRTETKDIVVKPKRRIVARAETNGSTEIFYALELEPKISLWRVTVKYWSTDHGVRMGPVESGKDVHAELLEAGLCEEEAMQMFRYYVGARKIGNAEIDGPMFENETRGEGHIWVHREEN